MLFVLLSDLRTGKRRGRRLPVPPMVELIMAAGSAIIFDLDDTLATTGAIWRRAENDLLATLGHTVTPELSAQYRGMNARDVAATMHRYLDLSVPLPDLQADMRRRLIAAFQAGPVTPVPGAVELARRLHGLAPLAVASGSPPEAIVLAVNCLGLSGCFTRLISSETVARGKPSPDVFLATAAALGADPARCVVFEDSLHGAKAAQAAGMICYVRPSASMPDLSTVATRVVSSWNEVTATDIAARLGVASGCH